MRGTVTREFCTKAGESAGQDQPAGYIGYSAKAVGRGSFIVTIQGAIPQPSSSPSLSHSPSASPTVTPPPRPSTSLNASASSTIVSITVLITLKDICRS